MNKHLTYLSKLALGGTFILGTSVLSADTEDYPFNMADYLDFESEEGSSVQSDLLLYSKAGDAILVDSVSIDSDSFTQVDSNCVGSSNPGFCYLTIEYQPNEETLFDEAIATVSIAATSYEVELYGLNLAALDCSALDGLEEGLEDEFDEEFESEGFEEEWSEGEELLWELCDDLDHDDYDDEDENEEDEGEDDEDDDEFGSLGTSIFLLLGLMGLGRLNRRLLK